MILDDVSYVSALGAGILSLVLYKIISFYSLVRKYPPGPFPLPILGNIPFLQTNGLHMHDAMEKYSKIYGPIFTIWLGPKPQILVYDTEACMEVLRSKTYQGRPHFMLAHHTAAKPGSINMTLGDFTREWEVVRRVLFTAIRRYATSYSLTEHTLHAADQIINRMKKNKNSIDMEPEISTLLVTLISASAVGMKYDVEDKELKDMVKTMEAITGETQVFFLFGWTSWMRFIFWSRWQQILRGAAYFRNIVTVRFKEHEETFNSQENRDFTDSLLWARLQAEEEEEPEILKNLDNWNIKNAVGILFFAGTQTTRTTLLWWFLFSSLNQDMQERIRKEVNEVLPGEDDVPLIEMKDKCPFLMAFTSEVMRMKAVVPFTVPHKNFEDKFLSGYKIPAGSSILGSLHHVMADKSVWKDADKFNPDRFIDPETGKFVQRPNNYWLPFSTGRRFCIGEKLAIADIFLIILRFFQKTQGFRHEVTPNPTTQEEKDKLLMSVDLKKLSFYEPKNYRLKLIPV